MAAELAKIETTAQLERVLIGGDLSKLAPDERVMYYKAVCASVGLNPLTKPFEYITLNGKLTLYARRDATDQLRAIKNVSITIKARELVEDCYIVTASAEVGARKDESIGAVSITGLKGESRANAMMKAETKAKRRVTLSICGLGMLDETEVETIPGARIEAQQSDPVEQTSVTISDDDIVLSIGPMVKRKDFDAAFDLARSIKDEKQREDIIAKINKALAYVSDKAKAA